MTADDHYDDRCDFVPLDSGFTNRIAQKLGLLEPASRRMLRIVVLIAITWLPIVLLAALSGHVFGDAVSISLCRDPEVNCRFLIALPFLELAEALIAMSLSTQTGQFLRSGIIVNKQRAVFDEIRAGIRRCHAAHLSEGLILLIALGASLIMRLYFLADSSSTWERLPNGVTAAGWWYILISLPLLYFFLLRALWIVVLWAWFLFQISKLDLELTATHPDHAGGIGFLGWGLVCFAPVAVAFSTVVSAGFAYEIYHRGASLDSLKYHMIIYVVLVSLFLHLPVLPFAGRLTRLRFHSLLEFSALVWRHDRAFDEKWIAGDGNGEQLLGTSDVQSLADIATSYNHVEEMGVIPFHSKAAIILALASAIPLIPLIGTEIPIREIIAKLGELLV